MRGRCEEEVLVGDVSPWWAEHQQVCMHAACCGDRRRRQTARSRQLAALQELGAGASRAPVEALVVTKAWPARALAPRAEPALKPNQPNHSSEVPSSTLGTLLTSLGMPSSRPLPMKRAPVRAA